MCTYFGSSLFCSSIVAIMIPSHFASGRENAADAPQVRMQSNSIEPAVMAVRVSVPTATRLILNHLLNQGDRQVVDIIMDFTFNRVIDIWHCDGFGFPLRMNGSQRLPAGLCFRWEMDEADLGPTLSDHVIEDGAYLMTRNQHFVIIQLITDYMGKCSCRLDTWCVADDEVESPEGCIVFSARPVVQILYAMGSADIFAHKSTACACHVNFDPDLDGCKFQLLWRPGRNVELKDFDHWRMICTSDADFFELHQFDHLTSYHNVIHEFVLGGDPDTLMPVPEPPGLMHFVSDTALAESASLPQH